MQVECIRAFGHHVPGDVAEVPDGAAVDPVHYRPVTRSAAPPERPVVPAAAPEVAAMLDGLAERVIPREGM